MIESQNEENGAAGANGCISCGHPVIVKGFPNALCEGCREAYIKHPVPKGIIAFAIGIGLVFLFSVYKIPRNISVGINLEKGKSAMQEKNYLTAQIAFEKVVRKIPANLEAQSNLFIAAYYNQDFQTFGRMYTEITGKNYEDLSLFHEVDEIAKQAANYFPSDSFTSLQHLYEDDMSKIPDDIFQNYIEKNKDELYPATAFAGRLYDKELYQAADSILTKVLSVNPENIPALQMMTSLKRIENKTDESITYCNKMLALNNESIYALASKVRTLLRQKKDADALSLALKTHQMDEQNMYASGSLIMAYHFNKKVKERDELLNKMSLVKDSASVQALQYVKDVVSGKENFRD